MKRLEKVIESATEKSKDESISSRMHDFMNDFTDLVKQHRGYITVKDPRDLADYLTSVVEL